MNIFTLFLINVLFYIFFVYFLFQNYINNNYNHNEILNEYEIYIIYRRIYRESIYALSPNISRIIILLKLAMEKNIQNVNVYIDIIRLFSIAYRRSIKSQICGDISESPNQMYTYYNYVKQLNIQNGTICEIGFLYGVSSLTLFLASGLSSKYYGFDYGHPQSKYIFSLLQQHFNMKMIWGKSQETVPFFNNSIICDIVHIDGSHIPELIYEDIKNIKKLSDSRTLLIVDDSNSNNYGWMESIKNDIIRGIYCSKYKSFCIGKFN